MCLWIGCLIVRGRGGGKVVLFVFGDVIVCGRRRESVVRVLVGPVVGLARILHADAIIKKDCRDSSSSFSLFDRVWTYIDNAFQPPSNSRRQLHDFHSESLLCYVAANMLHSCSSYTSSRSMFVITANPASDSCFWNFSRRVGVYRADELIV